MKKCILNSKIISKVILLLLATIVSLGSFSQPEIEKKLDWHTLDPNTVFKLHEKTDFQNIYFNISDTLLVDYIDDDSLFVGFIMGEILGYTADFFIIEKKNGHIWLFQSGFAGSIKSSGQFMFNIDKVIFMKDSCNFVEVRLNHFLNNNFSQINIYKKMPTGEYHYGNSRIAKLPYPNFLKIETLSDTFEDFKSRIGTNSYLDSLKLKDNQISKLSTYHHLFLTLCKCR